MGAILVLSQFPFIDTMHIPKQNTRSNNNKLKMQLKTVETNPCKNDMYYTEEWFVIYGELSV